MDIKIIGSNCKNGRNLYKMAAKAADDARNEVNILVLDDQESIKEYGIKNIPALIVEDKIVSEGKVLSEREIYKIIK